MSNNYYYLKLKEDFFDREEIKVIEALEHGYEFVNILLKLYLRSLKRSGELKVTSKIPYSAETLAKVLGHSVDKINKAVELFKEFGLLEVVDSGSMFMTDIHNFIGKSSDAADRKREYRSRIDSEKESGHMSGQMSGQIDAILKIETKKEKDIKNPDYIRLITLLISEIEKNDSAHFKNKDKEEIIDSWYDSIRLLIEKDGRTPEQVRAVITWSQSSDFWKSNILSTKKLRDKFSQLLLQMNSEKKKQPSEESEKSKYCPVCGCSLFNGVCPDGCNISREVV